MEYKLSDRGGAHLWNQKTRNLTFFSGISFYAKADHEVYAVFVLRESNSDDHTIMDVWRKIFPVDTSWKEYKIYFTDLGRSASYASRFPGGDGILSLDRVEAFSFAVGIGHNPPRSKGKICVDEISFFGSSPN